DDPPVTNFSDYEVRLEEAYHSNREDALVFRVTLKNKAPRPINPGSFALRVGNRVYPQSVSDAPGVIPANGESTVYFAVAGTPDGGVQNSFSVLVGRTATDTRKK